MNIFFNADCFFMPPALSIPQLPPPPTLSTRSQNHPCHSTPTPLWPLCARKTCSSPNSASTVPFIPSHPLRHVTSRHTSPQHNTSQHRCLRKAFSAACISNNTSPLRFFATDLPEVDDALRSFIHRIISSSGHIVKLRQVEHEFLF